MPDISAIERERYVEAATVRPDTEVARYFDFAGNPITNEQWNDLGEAVFRRIEVRPFFQSTRVSADKEVETAWRDRDWKESGPPDNWRTIIYEDGEHPRLAAFFATEEQAREGHAQTIAIEAPHFGERAQKGSTISMAPTNAPATPYKREIIGEFLLEAPRTIKGRDGVDYTIPAGPQSIVGAVSLDGYELWDAAIVYDTGRTAPETGKRIFIPEPLRIPELVAAQKKGLVKIDEPHQHKVAEAIARVPSPNAAARTEGRDLSAASKASLRNETNRHDERDVTAASKLSMRRR
jgi:hypothetical protein